MHALADNIITSWPDDIKEVPYPLHPYWQHCETLTIKDGFVLHGEALIVPPSERERNITPTTPVLSRNHQSPVAHVWMYLLAQYKQKPLKKLFIDVRPAPSSKPRMLQHLSLLHQLHLTHGRCAPWTSLPWKEPTTLYAVTSAQRWSLSNAFHLARVTPPKSSHCSKKCSQSMESQKSFTLTIVLNMLVPSLLISAPLGVSPMRPQDLTIHNQMDLQRHV